MTTLTYIRLGMAAAGLLIFGYGARIDDEIVRWAGIAILAVAVLLRFVRRR